MNGKNEKNCKSTDSKAKNVKQDNNNKKTDAGSDCRNSKTVNDSAVRGNRSARNERDDLSDM